MDDKIDVKMVGVLEDIFEDGISETNNRLILRYPRGARQLCFENVYFPTGSCRLLYTSRKVSVVEASGVMTLVIVTTFRHESRQLNIPSLWLFHHRQHPHRVSCSHTTRQYMTSMPFVPEGTPGDNCLVHRLIPSAPFFASLAAPATIDLDGVVSWR